LKYFYLFLSLSANLEPSHPNPRQPAILGIVATALICVFSGFYWLAVRLYVFGYFARICPIWCIPEPICRHSLPRSFAPRYPLPLSFVLSVAKNKQPNPPTLSKPAFFFAAFFRVLPEIVGLFVFSFFFLILSLIISII
jgi:hypothetical protein